MKAFITNLNSQNSDTNSNVSRDRSLNQTSRSKTDLNFEFKKIFLLFLSLPILFGFSFPLSELGARIFNQREINLQGMPMEPLLLQERTLRHQGNMFLDEGDYSKALEYYEKALALIPYKFETLYNKACTLALLNKKSEALHTLQLAGIIHNYAMDLATDDPDLNNLRDMPEFQNFIALEEA